MECLPVATPDLELHLVALSAHDLDALDCLQGRTTLEQVGQGCERPLLLIQPKGICPAVRSLFRISVHVPLGCRQEVGVLETDGGEPRPDDGLWSRGPDAVEDLVYHLPLVTMVPLEILL